MNILGLLNLWLGKALVSRGLGSSTGGGPPPVVYLPCPLLSTTPIGNTVVESSPIDNLVLSTTPIANTTVETDITC